MTKEAGVYARGIYRKDDVRISDLSGRKSLPIGDDSFTTTVENSVFIDKSMLIADLLDRGYKATLFCRPRRFGKSLNLSMIQRFFEIPTPDDPGSFDTEHLFRGLAIWDAEGGSYRKHHASYPVVHFSFNDAKQESWSLMRSTLSSKIASEYSRHAYLEHSEALNEGDKKLFCRMINQEGSPGDLAASLLSLTKLLFKHHRSRVIVLVDEYDVPVSAGHSFGYYTEVVSFMKGWLTAALKGNDALAFGVMTGVQRISKESIFSDLNNLVVDTALNVRSDERYGFTSEEVAALAEYLGSVDGLEDARQWYDGYRFGKAEIYNPWSVLSYFDSGCVPDVYWGNTASNDTLGMLIERASSDTLEKLYRLIEPEGLVKEPLDLSVVFADADAGASEPWSMLYLAGYLTTDDVSFPNDPSVARSLRIPNREIAKLFRAEIIARFAKVAGGKKQVSDLQQSFVEGDAEKVSATLSDILLRSPSYFDLQNENSYHMFLLGLLFGFEGYRDPLSNRESGRGRFDICLVPVDPNAKPLIIVELKYSGESAKPKEAHKLLAAAQKQMEDQAYGRDFSAGKAGRLCYALAFAGKDVTVSLVSSIE